MNRIKGNVAEIERDSFVCMIKLSTELGIFYVILLETEQTAPYLKAGKSVYLLFKETEVEIIKEFSSERTSFLNVFNAEVETIKTGKLLSKFDFKSSGGSISAVIPNISIEPMNLKVGEKVNLIVRATEISIEVIE